MRISLRSSSGSACRWNRNQYQSEDSAEYSADLFSFVMSKKVEKRRMEKGGKGDGGKT